MKDMIYLGLMAFLIDKRDNLSQGETQLVSRERANLHQGDIFASNRKSKVIIMYYIIFVNLDTVVLLFNTVFNFSSTF